MSVLRVLTKCRLGAKRFISKFFIAFAYIWWQTGNKGKESLKCGDISTLDISRWRPKLVFYVRFTLFYMSSLLMADISITIASNMP